jgi:ribonucleoside-triphosphate reductase
MSNEYFNSFGAGSTKIGSLGVVTLNLPKLATISNCQEEFLDIVEEYVTMCAEINNQKRKLIQKRIDNGNHPLYTFGFAELSKQYSTVGINGFNECLEILGEDILTESGQEFGLKIIARINRANDIASKFYNAPHNCEQIPAESVAVKLAEKDSFLGYNRNGYKLYSNQFIPLTTKADMLDRIRLQGIFDKHFSGGAIAHLNIDSEIKNPEDIVELVKSCAKAGVVYFSRNHVISECSEGHMSVTKGANCNICGKPVINTFTKVVGFLTNTKNWHKIRREEDFPNRQFYNSVELDGGDSI